MPTRSRKHWRRWASCTTLALCAACRESPAPVTGTIVLERGVAVREIGDSVLITNATGLVAGPQGQLIAVRIDGRGQIAFFDSTGRFVGLTGPRGKGPGEFMEISGAGLGPGDSLFVGDRLNGRVTVLSPRDHKPIRTMPADFLAVGFTPTPEGRLLGPGMVRRDGVMQRLSIRRASWSDSTTTPIASSIPMERTGPVAAAPGGKVWVADALTYTIRLFDGDREVRSIRRAPEWFPPDSSPITTFRWMGKGRPFITSMVQDSAGNLWVLIKRRNPRWTGESKAPPRAPISPIQLPPLDEIFEGVLEVIDPNGNLVDSRVVPGNMLRFISPGRLYQQADADSSGALMLQVWNARLRR
jgi:DNA-binding beta-propeller fold protein YncE